MASPSARSKFERSGKLRWSTTSVLTPSWRAISSPAACGSLLITAAISAGNPAFSNACMLLPRPEIKITMRFTRPSHDQSLRLACAPRPDAADAVCPLAGRAQLLYGELGFLLAYYRHHADAAVEDTEHLFIGHATFLL